MNRKYWWLTPLVALAILFTTTAYGDSPDGTPTPASSSSTAGRTIEATEGPRPNTGRTLTYFLIDDAWPGKAASGVNAGRISQGRDKLAQQLYDALNASDGWTGANLKFERGGPDAKIRLTILSQADIADPSKGGCQRGRSGKLPAGCAGSDEATCTLALLIDASSKNGALTQNEPARGDLYHELGHCFLGEAHLPGDPLMTEEFTSKHKTARPTPAQLEMVRGRAIGKIFVITDPRTD